MTHVYQGEERRGVSGQDRAETLNVLRHYHTAMVEARTDSLADMLGPRSRSCT
jgi:hypothetical protein